MKTLRTLSVLGLALFAALLMPGTAQAADASISHRFYADSGDDCRYGTTDGTMEWRIATDPGRALAVRVVGRLTDRPVPTQPSLCPDDRYYSEATYLAIGGSTLVDQEVRRVDNGILDLDFVLGSSTTVAGIDRVVVQVCRHPLYTLPPTYCGPRVEYRLPSTTP